MNWAGILPADGAKKLEEQWSTREAREFYPALQRGQQQVTKEAEPYIDLAAKWFTYRVTWPENQKTPGKMDDLVKTLRKELQSSAGFRPANQQFIQLFNKQLLIRLKEVLQDDKPIVRLNGARMLASVAENGYEEAADALVEIVLDDKQNDGTKFWALRGIGDLLRLGSQTPPVPFKDKEREARCILALSKFLARTGSYGTREEYEGFRVVRREAVRALAATRSPAVEVKGKMEGRPAQLLASVVAGSTNPEPRLDEKVEAAIGVLRLKSVLTKGYHPDYTAYFVGQFVYEFAQRYVTKKEGDRDFKEPWKVYTARLNDALDAFKADAREDKSAEKYIGDLIAKCAPVLKGIESGAKVDADILNTWLRDNPPKNTLVYEGVKDSAIAVPQKPAAGAQE